MATPFDPIFDEPARFEAASKGFGSAELAKVCGVHATLIGLAAAVGWLAPATVPEHGGNYALPVLLFLPQPVLLYLGGRAFLARERERFSLLNAVSTLVNFTWLGTLGWAAPSLFAPVYLSIFFMWAYHDAWLTSGRGVRLLYAVAFPALDLVLLAWDALGQPGLVWAHGHEGTFLWEVLALQVVAGSMVQLLIGAVGAQSEAQHEQLAEAGRLAREVAVMQREREVVQASCNLLSAGLVASKFSHDVASPTSVLSLDARELRRRIERLPPNQEQGELMEIADELDEIAHRITEMAGGLARSIRTEDPLVETDIARLLDDAESQTRVALRGHGRAAVAVSQSTVAGTVWASDGHVGTLSNLLTNGALHTKEGTGVEVVGTPLSPWFYLLEIRDHGVTAGERSAALLRIRELLAFTGEPRAGVDYRGFGIGLLLAKLHLLRTNGWIDVSVPLSGAGMVLQVVLPRVDPRSIPETENRPEAALRAARPAISSRAATLPPPRSPP